MALSCALLLACCAGQFLFAGAETGFVTWNTLKIGHRAAQGDVLARWGVFLMERKDALLAAVLIWTNICVVGSALAFLAAYREIDTLVPFDLSLVHSPESWFLTPLLVVFCEMLPKSLFRIYSFRLTLRAVPILMVAYALAWPLTWVFGRAVSLAKRSAMDTRSFLTRKREEMVLVAMEGARRGDLFGGADVPIKTILALKARSVSDLAQLENVGPDAWMRVNADTTVGEACSQAGAADADEFVLLERNSGDALGTVSVLDLMAADESLEVVRLARQVPVVPPETSGIACLESSDAARRRFVVTQVGDRAVVVDRMKLYGALFGSGGDTGFGT